MDRRTFLKSAAVTAGLSGTALLAACEKKPPPGEPAPAAVTTAQATEWRMVTTWPPGLPILQESAERIAASVERMTGGRFRIRVYGGGELVPPLGAFDAASQGTVEMSHGAAYYWAGKAAAAQFFTTVPFGMNAQQTNAWLVSGGLDLWRELYAPFDMVPFQAGNSGVQMGGWFRKEIKTLRDLKGLKMRIPGLGGDVLRKAGGTPIGLPANEIFKALERGVIDATEWVGPLHDLKMGFYQAARYYYYPAWQEPSAVIECAVNKTAWEALSPELQAILEMAVAEAAQWVLASFEAANPAALKELVEQHDVRLVQFPNSILRELRTIAEQILGEVADRDPMARKVYDSYTAFQKANGKWQEISEWAMQHALSL